MTLQNKILSVAKDTILNEAKAVAHLESLLDDSFSNAVECIYNSKGRVIITGIGKSAIIATKIVAKSFLGLSNKFITICSLAERLVSSGSKSVGANENKATSEPDINAEHKSSTISTIMLKICEKSKETNNNGKLEGSGSKYLEISLT